MVEIPHGDKTIKIAVLFFANDLPNRKMAWQKGVVRAITNRSRGIRDDGNPIPFNKFEEIPEKIKQLLKKHEIVLADWDNKSKSTKILEL